MELATAAISTMSAFAAHPLLMEGVGPAGTHEPYGDEYAFPRKDEDGKCWIPEGFTKDDLQFSAADYEGEENPWADYEDPASEVVRLDCEEQSWMEVCSIPLYWDSVKCGVYDSSPSSGKKEKKGIILPTWAVVIVQVLETLWELNIVFIVTLPWWAILATIAAVEWIIDWIWVGLFIWWCKPCAMVFIWIFNIAFLPFHIGGWL